MVEVTKERIMEELEKVIDPHVGMPITELHLVDKISIEAADTGRAKVRVDFHGTIPFCPMAAQIGIDIKNKLKYLPGVASVRVEVNNHVNASEINKQINKE